MAFQEYNISRSVEDGDQLGSVMYFLGVFAGHWLPGNERSQFSCCYDFRPGGMTRYYLQVHFRCFTHVDSLDWVKGTDGLRCLRKHFEIASDDPGVTSYIFQERRISIFGILSTGTPIVGEPAGSLFYRVLVLAESGMDLFSNVLPSGFGGCEGLEGTIAFQIAVLEAIAPWEAEWNSVLDKIDIRLQFSLETHLRPEEIRKWMFDDHFERSELYFTILQVLRVFGEYIRTLSLDLHYLDEVFSPNGPSDFPLKDMRPDELRVMRENWKTVMEAHQKAEKRLLGRLSDKTEEVKSLRDGV
jgi:hypothetical protein